MSFNRVIMLAILLISAWRGITPSYAACVYVKEGDHQDLQLSVLVNKSAFKKNDNIRIFVIFTNKSSLHPIYIYNNLSWSKYAGLSILVIDADGSKRLLDFNIDHMQEPAKEDDLGAFVRIWNPNFFGTTIEIPVAMISKKKGVYRIRAKYNSSAQCSMYSKEIQHLPVVWHKDGYFFSNIVSIKINQ